MAKRRSGLNPLAYLGVEPGMPVNFFSENRAPTTADSRNKNIGDLWEHLIEPDADPPAADIYMLVALIAGEATWQKFGESEGELTFLTADSGGPVPPDANNNINVLGGTAITTAGVPGTNTITINVDGDVATQYDADAGTAIPVLGILNVLGGTSVSTVGAGNTITINADGDLANSYVCDVGSAVPALNVLNVFGTHGINTDGVGNTVVVAIDNAITLGDLSVIAVGDPALTITTGDIDFLGDINDPLEQRFIVFPGDNRIFFFLNNVFMGAGAGNTTMTAGVALFNIGIGPASCVSLTTGNQNVAVGNATLQDTTTGQNNIMVGFVAGLAITTGNENIGIGPGAFSDVGGIGLLTGNCNIAIGNGAGHLYRFAESDNILLNNIGVLAENNTLRIGAGAGTGNQQLNRAFIHGIRGITTGNADAIAVLVDSAGQLGTVSSSLKFKENIEDIDNVSKNIYDLNPVSFNYKSDDSKTKQFGLIAEDVEKVIPELVAYQDGEVYSVKYQQLSILLLNEIKMLRKEIDDLKKNLS